MAAGLETLTTYNPWTVSPFTTLHEVAQRFRLLGIHHVVVVDDQRHVQGIVSETDLLRARQARRLLPVGGGEADRLDVERVLHVMSSHVRQVSSTASFAEALAILIEHRIHSLPVVECDQLVGIITSRDFLREMSYGETHRSRESISRYLRPAGESLEPETMLGAALVTMQETGCDCLAVVKGDCPLGVVSQRDIVRTRQGLEDPLDADQTTIMRITHPSPAIRPGQRLCEAAAALVEHELPAVTVVNQSNRLLGILTEDDLLRLMYDDAR